jgi:hypothetical protein
MQKDQRHRCERGGKEETPARRFFEKNGFKPVKEAGAEAPCGKITLVTY